MKTCPICKETKPLTDFRMSRNEKDGRTYECKKCLNQKAIDRLQDPAARERRREIESQYRARNRANINERARAKYRENREICIAHYGGKCECCGETRFEFLALDHINGGGTTHRKELGSSQITAWLIANNFPEGYRVLCHNCNLAYGFYGYCPHQKE